MKQAIYLMGSLRNPEVEKLAQFLRGAGYDVFDDFKAAGPNADDHWKDYEKQRGHTYIEALKGYAARHVFEFDQYHLDRCQVGVLLLPAGKSCHLELGYLIGQKKPGYIVLPPECESGVDFRFDVMYNFATAVVTCKEDLLSALERLPLVRYIKKENPCDY